MIFPIRYIIASDITLGLIADVFLYWFSVNPCTSPLYRFAYFETLLDVQKTLELAWCCVDSVQAGGRNRQKSIE